MAKDAIISVRDLCFSYGSGVLRKEVLHNISVDFHRGEICVIMGPSGSGKTTFLTLLAGFRSVNTGSLCVNGIELRGANKTQLRRLRQQIGFIFQTHNLLEALTALENVQMAFLTVADISPTLARAKAMQALNAVELAEHANKLPCQLSVGQKQRVAIARALVREPHVIMADEPTASLDGRTGRETVTLLRRLADESERAILMVTHDTRILDVADRIVTLEDGNIEDSSLSFDRIFRLTATVGSRLGTYLSRICCGDPGSNADLLALVTQNQQDMDIVLRQTAAILPRQQCARLADQATRLNNLVTRTNTLTETARELAILLTSRDSEQMPTLSDLILQAADSLLQTAAEAFSTTSAADLEILLAISASKNETMAQIRDKYMLQLPQLDEDGKAYLFELTNTYARMVHVVNQCATALKEWNNVSEHI